MGNDKKKRRILVIDDSPINIKLLGETLMDDYDISVSTNGPEGIELALSNQRPDLILLDIMMPGMDGYEVCRILKANFRTKHIPIIFITAINEEEEETKGFRLGAVDYITKPFSPEIVKARVGTHLELKLYQDHLEELVRERTEDLRKSHEQLEKRVEERTAELSRSNLLLTQEINERKYSEAALRENEEYLRTIMATIQTGVLIIDPRTRKIMDANPWFAQMVGYSQADLIGTECFDITDDKGADIYLMPKFCQTVSGGDCILSTRNNTEIHVRRSYAKAVIRDHQYYIHSFLDITDIKQLLNKQEMNIDLAKNLLKLINHTPPRHIIFSENISLFIESCSIPCHAEGGDHFFVRTISNPESPPKTILSLKDQSGHEVSCMLRSIITDLLHHSFIKQQSPQTIDKTITQLNEQLCRSGAFNPDDFFTSITAEIDHNSLNLKYLSAGHPSFILIRDQQVMCMPEIGQSGANIPLAFITGIDFSYGEIDLKPEDKLIFYTDGLTEMPLNSLNKVITNEELIDIIADFITEQPEARVAEIMEYLLKKISTLSHQEFLLPHEKNGPKNTSGDDVTMLCLEIEAGKNRQEIRLKPKNADEISEHINIINDKLSEAWRQHGYQCPEERLRIILEESLLNAWRHGNKMNPHQEIIIRWGFDNDFCLEIIDQGQGFDLNCVPDPTQNKNIDKPGGRGIFIIRHFTDCAAWEKNGSHLYAWFAKQKLAEDKKQDENALKLW